MRKFFTIILALAASVEIVFADGTKVNGIWYNFDNIAKTASVTYQGSSCFSHSNRYKGEVVIPSSVTYKKQVYAVTSIGEDAFYDCSSLISVTIPNSVTIIGGMAFEGCSSLISVTIPNSVTNIGLEAFSRCLKLTTINIPGSVIEIFHYSFRNCPNMTAIKVNASNPKYYDVDGVLFGRDRKELIHYPIGKTATSYTIPNGVTGIGDDAFGGCTNLKSITIPNSVTYIGYYAFRRCSSLTSVTIPENVTRIGWSAFEGCSSLTSIIIPNSVISIFETTFKNCSNMTSVELSNNVEYIGKSAFEGCSKLTSLTIPESVTSIESMAFFGCTSLKSVTIGSRVSKVGYSAFYGCTNLKECNYPKGLDLSKANLPSPVKLLAYDKKKSTQPKSTPPQQQSKSSQPPMLAMQSGSVVFSDATQNNIINAGEQCSIRFQVQNNGKGAATGCEARVTMSGAISGIKVQTVKLPTIAVGQTYEVNIPVSADIHTKDGEVTLSIEVYEPNGWGVAPFDLTVATKAYEAPMLQVVDYNIASASGKIRKMEPFTLTFNLQNTQYGTAEDVKVNVKLPANVFVMDGKAELSFPTIKAGEAKSVQLTLAANNNYPTTNIPVAIDIQEKYGKFAKNRQIDIALNQSAAGSVTIAAKDEPKQERQEIQLALMTAETDRDIPNTGIQNKNTFVVIIANENYQQVAVVPFALNDGKVFRQYCEKTLGIPAKNIREQTNATGGQIQGWLDWLQRTVKAYENDHPNVIFYYAGHGIPDENSRTAYLLPVDGMPSNMNTCYKLDDLYTTLGNMPADRITVFMDACFSGSKREQGMIAEARGVALRTRPGQPKGNMVVFSAAQGDETAYPYNGKQHGMFTYFLLKKLQDTKGDVPLKELGDYVTEQVSKTAIVENDKPQTPCVTPSNTVGTDWQNWRLR